MNYDIYCSCIHFNKQFDNVFKTIKPSKKLYRGFRENYDIYYICIHFNKQFIMH